MNLIKKILGIRDWEGPYYLPPHLPPTKPKNAPPDKLQKET